MGGKRCVLPKTNKKIKPTKRITDNFAYEAQGALLKFESLGGLFSFLSPLDFSHLFSPSQSGTEPLLI